MERLNPTTLTTTRRGKPLVSFNASGLITLNAEAYDRLELAPTSRIEFIVDDGNAYLTVCKDGFELRHLKKNEAYYGFSNIHLKRKLTELLGIEASSFSCTVLPEPIKMKGFTHPLYQLMINK